MFGTVGSYDAISDDLSGRVHFGSCRTVSGAAIAGEDDETTDV